MKSANSAINFFALCLPVIYLANPRQAESGRSIITYYFTEPVQMIKTLIVSTGAYIYNLYTGKNKLQQENS